MLSERNRRVMWLGPVIGSVVAATAGVVPRGVALQRANSANAVKDTANGGKNTANAVNGAANTANGTANAAYDRAYNGGRPPIWPELMKKAFARPQIEHEAGKLQDGRRKRASLNAVAVKLTVSSQCRISLEHGK